MRCRNLGCNLQSLSFSVGQHAVNTTTRLSQNVSKQCNDSPSSANHRTPSIFLPTCQVRIPRFKVGMWIQPWQPGSLKIQLPFPLHLLPAPCGKLDAVDCTQKVCQNRCLKRCQKECQNMLVYIYIAYILPRNYVRIVWKGGVHSKKVICVSTSRLPFGSPRESK